MVEVFENINGIVRIEIADRSRDLLVRHLVDDLHTDGFVDFGKSRKVEILAEQFDQRQALVRQDRFEQVTKFGFMQLRDILPKEKHIAVSNSCPDARQKVRPDRTVFGIDIMLLAAGFPADERVVLDITHQPPSPCTIATAGTATENI
ncbi:hypothetical protein D3C73_587040 [compost metagenome]